MTQSEPSTTSATGSSEDPTEAFIDEDGIKIGALVSRLFTSWILAVGSGVAAIIELWSGVLSGAASRYYGALQWLFSAPFDGWTGLVDAAWTGAGESVGELGLFAFVGAVVLVSAWFVLLASALETFVGST